MKRWIVAAALALAACGVDDGARPYGSVGAIARALGDRGSACSDLRREPRAELIRDAAACSLEDERARVTLFAGSDARREWLALAGAFPGVHVVGPNWVVSTSTQAAARRVRDALGGEIR